MRISFGKCAMTARKKIPRDLAGFLMKNDKTSYTTFISSLRLKASLRSISLKNGRTVSMTFAVSEGVDGIIIPTFAMFLVDSTQNEEMYLSLDCEYVINIGISLLMFCSLITPVAVARLNERKTFAFGELTASFSCISATGNLPEKSSLKRGFFVHFRARNDAEPY